MLLKRALTGIPGFNLDGGHAALSFSQFVDGIHSKLILHPWIQVSDLGCLSFPIQEHRN